MKACMLILLSLACGGIAVATPPEKAPAEHKPDQNLGEVKAEKPVKLEKAVAKKYTWTKANYGVLGQFAQAPTVLAPINPMAGPEAGQGEVNLSRDTVTRRIMGLHLLKLEF